MKFTYALVIDIDHQKAERQTLEYPGQEEGWFYDGAEINGKPLPYNCFSPEGIRFIETLTLNDHEESKLP